MGLCSSKVQAADALAGADGSTYVECAEAASLPDEVRKKYIATKKLGDGMSGIVFKVISRANMKSYALKTMHLEGLPQEDVVSAHKEVALLQILHHPNILKYVEHFESPGYMFLATEIVSGGELFDSIVERDHYTEHDARHVVYILLKALEYLHNKNIVHRDLKPENIMLSDSSPDADIILVDFGLSQKVPDDFHGITEGAGTPGYLSPESLKRHPNYGKPADIWALGVIAYILLCGYPPFYADDDRDLFRDIINVKYEFEQDDWQDLSVESMSFIQSIFTPDPRRRPNVSQLFEHPWMKKHHEPQGKGKHLERAHTQIKKHKAKKDLKAGIEMVMFMNRAHRLHEDHVKRHGLEDLVKEKHGEGTPP
jgi:serine/threonine protein kinase